MNADERRQELNRITERIIGSAFSVAKVLGNGFLEKVYENALAHELRRGGVTVAQQAPVEVWYDDLRVGEYFADLLVADEILVELKVAQALDDIHMAQCMNYLKATGKRVCLLINFGKPRVEIKRVVNGF